MKNASGKGNQFHENWIPHGECFGGGGESAQWMMRTGSFGNNANREGKQLHEKVLDPSGIIMLQGRGISFMRTGSCLYIPGILECMGLSCCLIM